MSFGAFQSFYALQYLPDYSSSSISWIGTVEGALLVVVGLGAGPLYDLGHYHAVSLTGMALTVFGVLMLSLSTTYWQIFLSQGVCVGLGCGLLYVPTLSLVGDTFAKQTRAVAMGIVTSGIALGQLYPPSFFLSSPPPPPPPCPISLTNTGHTTRRRHNLHHHLRAPHLPSGLRLDGPDPRPRQPGRLRPGRASPAGASGQGRRQRQEALRPGRVPGRAVPHLHHGPVLHLSRLPGPSVLHTHLCRDRPGDGQVPVLVPASRLPGRLPRRPADGLGPCPPPRRHARLVRLLCRLGRLVPRLDGRGHPPFLCGLLRPVRLLRRRPRRSSPSIFPVLCPDPGTLGSRMGLSWTTAAMSFLIGTPVAGALLDLETRDFTSVQAWSGATMIVGAIILVALWVMLARRQGSIFI